MARQVKARATQPDNVIDVQNSCGEDRKLIPATSPLSHVCAHIQSHISWKIDCMTSEKRSHPVFYRELDPCVLTDVRNPLESLSTDRTSLAYLKLLSCWRSTFLTLFLSAHHCPRGFQSPDIIRAMGIHTSEHWWRDTRSVPFSCSPAAMRWTASHAVRSYHCGSESTDPHKHSFSVVFLRKLSLRSGGLAVTNLDLVVQSLQNGFLRKFGMFWRLGSWDFE